MNSIQIVEPYPFETPHKTNERIKNGRARASPLRRFHQSKLQHNEDALSGTTLSEFYEDYSIRIRRRGHHVSP